jgi:hypothetical protein
MAEKQMNLEAVEVYSKLKKIGSVTERISPQ